MRKKKRAGFLAFDLDKDEVIVRERRTPPAFAALLNAQQMLDDAKAGILATGWQPGAAHALTLNMLCDDGYTRVLMLPELTAERYQALVKNAPTHEEMMHDMEMGTDHDHSDHAD